MKSIAIGILTYYHPEAVQEMLSLSAQYLYDLQIDVYYYDGSGDTRTKEVVESFRDKGFTNLYHLHYPESSQEDRAEMIFSGQGMLHEYDYIWPSKDRCMFTDEVMKAVRDILEEDPDVVCLNKTFDHHGIHKLIYHEPTKFYEIHGWDATSINTILFKKSTMIGSFQHWIYPTLFNFYYSHLFHTLARMDTMNICVLYGDHIMIYDSPSAFSLWENNVFKIWKDDWIKVNDLLPECYAPYKDYVIKVTASLPWLIGDVKRLQDFHNKGLLTPETMSKVEPNWERVSYVPIEIVREIAAGTYDSAHDMRRVVSQNEFMDMTLSVHKMLLNGQMSADMIPWEAFQNYIRNRLQGKSHMNTEEVTRVLTVIEDLKAFVNEKPDHPKRTANIIQILLSILFFTERDNTFHAVSIKELWDLVMMIYENVQDGFMKADNIPWKAFRDYIHETLEKLNVVEITHVPLIAGSICDLEQLSLEQPGDTERLTKLINIVIVFLILIEKS